MSEIISIKGEMEKLEKEGSYEERVRKILFKTGLPDSADEINTYLLNSKFTQKEINQKLDALEANLDLVKDLNVFPHKLKSTYLKVLVQWKERDLYGKSYSPKKEKDEPPSNADGMEGFSGGVIG